MICNLRPIRAVIYTKGKNLKICLRSTDKYGTDTSAIANVCMVNWFNDIIF
ncbi:hypothetical protein Hanom_Chr17g01570951 [Helianthus anomalus]